MTSVGKNIEELELLCAVGGNAKWFKMLQNV